MAEGPSLKRQRIPVVFSATEVDCGAAALAMVLGYHGHRVSLEQVRQTLDVRQGTSADQILRAGRLFGLLGHGVKAELSDLDNLDPGTILHWDFDHFVVFESVRRSRVRILDPEAGRRDLSLEEFGKSFTGVALLFEPGPDFEKRDAQPSNFRRYLLEVLRDSGLWARILVTSLLLQVFSLSLPFVTGAVVETIIPRADTHFTVLVAAGLGLVIASNLAAMVVRGLLLLFWRARFDARLTPGLLGHLLSLPLEYLEQRSAVQVSVRIGSATVVRDALTSGLLSGLLDGVLVLSYGVLVIWISPGLGVVTLLLALAQAAVFGLTWRQQRLQFTEEIVAGEKLSSATHEILWGFETVKGQGLEGRVFQQWSGAFVDAQNAHVRHGKLTVWVDAVSATLRLGSPLVVLMLGTLQVISGAMSLGTMLALNAVAAGLFLPISSLVQTARQLNSLARHVDRMNDVFAAQPENLQAADAPVPLSGEISLEKVSYQYSRTSPFAIEDVSFRCKAGEYVALVGRSGSGKSTLAKLIAGLYRPASGEIRYDGRTVDQVGLPALRSQVGYVAQRPSFMMLSIRLNIANYDPAIPQERVEAAARAACVHDDILQLPMRYETTLLNDAGTISGGQRQRIALARALIVEPKVLILDEATNALDAFTEHEVYQGLQQQNRTRIVIAHRLSTIVRADRIVVMDAGRVVAVGPHRELMEQCALYRELIEAQTRG